MRKIVDPFSGLKKYEAELKRHDLYKEIKDLLIKHEAYDDSPIGHEFVAHYERELPGIITAHAGSHSFINGDNESNVNVIMESVDKGMALKAGLIAAILLLVYKIIRVITNNKDFRGAGGGGGGRGSSTATKVQVEALSEQASRFEENKNKLNKVIPAITSNPVLREDDSKVMREAETLTTHFVVDSDGNATKADDPINTLKNLKFVADVSGLAAFFAYKDTSYTGKILKQIDVLYSGLDKFNLSAFHANMMTAARYGGDTDLPSTIKAFNNENVVVNLQKQISNIVSALGLESSIKTVDDLRSAFEQYTAIDRAISRSYKNVLADDPNTVLSIEELSSDLLGVGKGGSKIEFILAHTTALNEKFIKVLDSQPELEDSQFYQDLDACAASLRTAKDALARDKPEDYNVALQRVGQYISLIELFTRNVLKLFALFRRQSDSGNVFLDNNKTLLEKVNKSIETIVDQVETGEVI